MRASTLQQWPVWAVALVFGVVVLFAGSRDVFWMGDFYLEAYPSYDALMAGDVGRFFELLPGYSGFTVVIGAPAALLTDLLGGIETMVYRFTAVPGLVALGALAVVVGSEVRRAGNRWWPVYVLALAGGALTLETLRAGHPEDLLATALAVGAVLAARAGRVNFASALLVAAVVSKQWAVVAILPAALAAPRGGLRIAGSAAFATAALVLLQTQAGSAAHGAITTTGSLFHPHQVWWPFGLPATPEFIAAGHGERMGPDWVAALARPVIVGAAAAVAIAWWWSGGRRRNLDDVFGVLALAFLLRCALDPWNLVYYHLPLVVALAVWDVRRGHRLPVLSVVATAATWLTFMVYDARTGNGPFFAYLAWAIPLGVAIAVTILRPARAPRREPAGALPAPAAA